MKDKNIKSFNEHQENLNVSDLETIENKIIEYLNEADAKLNAADFGKLAESIINYIDYIGRSKK